MSQLLGKVSRREALAMLVAVAGTTAAGGCGRPLTGTSAPAADTHTAGAPVVANAQAPRPLRRVAFGFATKTISPLAINLTIGQELGYFQEEGLDAEFKAISAHAALLEGIKSGSLQFSVGSPTFLLPLVARGEPYPAVQFYEYTYPFKWDWAVLPESPIRDLGDLRGKRVGVASFGTVEQNIGKAMLRRRGIDPDTEVTWQAVGEGTPGHVALRRGDIDAMIYSDTGFGAWDVAGLPYRLLPRPPDVPQVGGFFIQALPSLLRDERPVAVGFARAVAKGTVFALENPDAAAKIFLKLFPENLVPSKSFEENARDARRVVERRMPLWLPPEPGMKLGAIREREWWDEVEFLGLSGKISDVRSLYTNELIDEINAFDAEAIRAQARAYA
jgi:NitT/TauT family transport system substrate-binding protein